MGKRVPTSLLTFIVALAIVDDLGAVLVIPLFYTDTINMMVPGLSGVMFLIMISFNKFGIHIMLPYFRITYVCFYA